MDEGDFAVLVSGKVLILEDLALILLDMNPERLHAIIAALERHLRDPRGLSECL